MITLRDNHKKITEVLDMSLEEFTLKVLPFIVSLIDFKHELTLKSLLTISLTKDEILNYTKSVTPLQSLFLLTTDYVTEASSIFMYSAKEIESGMDLKEVMAIQLLQKTRPSIYNISKVESSVIIFNIDDMLMELNPIAKDIIPEDTLKYAFVHASFILTSLYNTDPNSGVVMDYEAYKNLNTASIITSLYAPPTPEIVNDINKDDTIDTIEKVKKFIEQVNTGLHEAYESYLLVHKSELGSTIYNYLTPIIKIFELKFEGYYIFEVDALYALILMRDYNIYPTHSEDILFSVGEIFMGYNATKDGKIGFDSYGDVNYNTEHLCQFTGRTQSFPRMALVNCSLYKNRYIDMLDYAYTLPEVFSAVSQAVSLIYTWSVAGSASKSDSDNKEADVYNRIIADIADVSFVKMPDCKQDSLLRGKSGTVYKESDFNLHINADLLYTCLYSTFSRIADDLHELQIYQTSIYSSCLCFLEMNKRNNKLNDSNKDLTETLALYKEKANSYDFVKRSLDNSQQELAIFSKKYHTISESYKRDMELKDEEIAALKEEVKLLRTFIDDISESKTDVIDQDTDGEFIDNAILITNNAYLLRSLQSYPNIQTYTFDSAMNKDWASNTDPVFLNVSYAGHGDWAKLESQLKVCGYNMLPNITNVNLLLSYMKKLITQDGVHWRCLGNE